MRNYKFCLGILIVMITIVGFRVFFISECKSEDIRDAGELMYPSKPKPKPVYNKKPVHYHNNSQHCSATHCNHSWCSCGSGASHSCGGGCTWGSWQLYNGTQHAQLCTRGCGRTNGLHNAAWKSWSSNHTIECNKCTLVGSHTANWATNYSINSSTGNHEQKCTNKYITTLAGKSVNINSQKSCTATRDVHSPEFTAPYYKMNAAGESNGSAQHRRDCQHSGCNLSETHNPTWGEWTSISDDQHRRSCIYGSGCDLTQTLQHNKVYTPIEGDIHNHIVTCDSGDTDHPCPYYAIKEHVDSNPRDGKCDLCKDGNDNFKLYQIEYDPEPTELTNKDVTVTVTMYDVGNKTDITKSHIYTKNNLNELEEERYEFVFDGIDTSRDQIRPIVDHINKSVSGRIKYEPNKPTSEPVTITFLPDYEEETYGDYQRAEYGNRSKQIYGRILIDGEPIPDWQLAETASRVPTITHTFTENGSCEIELYDTVGNGNRDSEEGKQSVKIPVMVDWIVSGQATVATTSNVLENGTVFTDLLINADKEWNITDAQQQIAVKIYQITAEGNIVATEKSARISKLEVKDYTENRITETPIGRGLYYIKVGIGGPGIFTSDPEQESTRYIVEISTITPNQGEPGLTILGKNRIEVTVNKLNDLT
ncbi:MAG: hypothetical protein J6M02_03445 [Clostridia bacterium]|nr:hypothetical protein [Clostridia bacterium]